MTSTTTRNLDWLLDDLLDRLPDVRYAVVLSADGLPLGRSTALTEEQAEHFSAWSSAVHSLARAVGQRFDGGGVRQAVIELDDLVAFVTDAGANACLALIADAVANMGLVAYEMNQTVQRVGAFLAAEPRRTASDPGGGRSS
ncbi:roadblock/LC7 domain-containing protein [Nocardia sp. NPDC004860]|uniref:roadblock/LC7 domain-containing protein n=1 Tax=Nocardia sp. NPDC004860 TaxID=3154557 RepID=UPI00339FD8A1